MATADIVDFMSKLLKSWNDDSENYYNYTNTTTSASMLKNDSKCLQLISMLER